MTQAEIILAACVAAQSIGLIGLLLVIRRFIVGRFERVTFAIGASDDDHTKGEQARLRKVARGLRWEGVPVQDGEEHPVDYADRLRAWVRCEVRAAECARPSAGRDAGEAPPRSADEVPATAGEGLLDRPPHSRGGPHAPQD